MCAWRRTSLTHLPRPPLFSTDRCLPSKEDLAAARAAGFDYTYTENHWADKRTTKQHFDRIVAPFLRRQREKLGLPPDFPAVVILDCWSVHISAEIRAWVAKAHPDVRVLFVPANCTGRMQPCDLAGQRELKCALRAIGTMYASVQVEAALNALDGMGLSPEEREQKIAEGFIKIDTSISALKPYLGDWHLEAFKSLQEKGVFLTGWQRSRLLEVWDPAKHYLLYEVAERKHKDGTLWRGTEAGAGDEHVPVPLTHVLRATVKKTKDADGRDRMEMVRERVAVHEPPESETDIAQEEKERERAAACAEEVRGCWLCCACGC